MSKRKDVTEHLEDEIKDHSEIKQRHRQKEEKRHESGTQFQSDCLH